MPKPGDIVILDFPGAQRIKRRPAVVVSTDLYHNARPDVILGLLTTNLATATAPTDYILQDWQTAGLRNASAFRAFLATMPVTSITVVGHLSNQDWQEVQRRLNAAIAVK